MLHLEQLELITRNSDSQTEVFRAFDPQLQLPVCLKRLHYSSFASAGKGSTEVNNQMRFRSPHVCQVYNFQVTQTDEDTYVLEIEMELLQCNGKEAIVGRKGEVWKESDLVEMLKGIVSALATGQRHGLSHRDIKTANILFGKEGVKLADFGCSKWVQGQTLSPHTLQGTCGFLSPLLRQSYVQFLTDGQPRQVQHNVYKSDVYSLGVTFLCFAKLLKDPPNPPYESIIQTMTAYPRLSTVIRSMLEEEESKRPDFIALEEQLGSMADTTDVVPEASMSIDSQGTIQPLPQSPSPVPLCTQCGGVLQSTAWQSALSLDAMRNYAQTLGFLCSEKCFESFTRNLQLLPQRCLLSSSHSFTSGAGWRQDCDVTGSLEDRVLRCICSRGCWERIMQGLESGEFSLCLYCHSVILIPNPALQLECGHSFCSHDCFRGFFQSQTQYFTVRTSLACPTDHQSISTQCISRVLRQFWPHDDFRTYSWYCQYDLAQEGLYRLPCGVHYVCKNCLGHFENNQRRCYYCQTA